MLNKFKKNFQLKHLIIACQLLILFIALLLYIMNRGKAYTHSFSWDELRLGDNVVVGETLSATEPTSDDSTFARTHDLSLDKGTYRILVDYSTDSEGGELRISGNDIASIDWNCTPLDLSPDKETGYITLELTRPSDQVVIKVSYSGEDTFTLKSLSIYETSALYKKNLFYALLLCGLLSFGYYFHGCDIPKRRRILALLGIWAISCYPLLKDYLIAGDDIPFHLLRIEGIAAGLSQGSFPVKIHPVWAQDYGYAVGVFYGDFALYLPAVLRLLGFSIQTSFNIFVAFTQLATVLVAYYTFKRMFKGSNIGLLGSLIYSLSQYRLMDVYTRNSVGEFLAMLFFPVVFCGFYLIFMESDKTNWWKHAILTAFGLTGLVQTHILSCEMTLFFIAISCVILLPLVIKPYKFKSLALGAVLTVFMNLGFLIPFLNYFNEDIMIHSSEWVGSTNGAIQDTGLFLLQLFSLFQKSTGGTWPTSEGLQTEASFGMGIIYLIGIGLLVYLLLCCGKECAKHPNFRPACFSLVLGGLALWMSTCYFPWDNLAKSNPILNKLIVSVEFPWRMLAPATVFLTFVCCFAFSQLSLAAKEYTPLVLCSCIVLLFINTCWYFYDLCYSKVPYRIYDIYELDTMAMYSCDYLPAGTDPGLIKEGQVFQENVFIENYHKEGTKILCRITAEDQGGWVDFPLNYYQDYHCISVSSGYELEVSAGTNNMVRITLPGGFSDTIQVSFREPLHWRMSEIISLLTILGCIAVISPISLRKNHCGPRKN